jgi:hypothetical protein
MRRVPVFSAAALALLVAAGASRAAETDDLATAQKYCDRQNATAGGEACRVDAEKRRIGIWLAVTGRPHLSKFCEQVRASLPLLDNWIVVFSVDDVPTSSCELGSRYFLTNVYSIYGRIKWCYQRREGYALVLINDEELSQAQEAVRAIETTIGRRDDEVFETFAGGSYRDMEAQFNEPYMTSASWMNWLRSHCRQQLRHRAEAGPRVRQGAPGLLRRSPPPESAVLYLKRCNYKGRHTKNRPGPVPVKRRLLRVIS